MSHFSDYLETAYDAVEVNGKAYLQAMCDYIYFKTKNFLLLNTDEIATILISNGYLLLEDEYITKNVVPADAHKIEITKIETIDKITHTLAYTNQDTSLTYEYNGSITTLSFGKLISEILGTSIITTSKNNNLTIYVGERNLSISTTIEVKPLELSEIESTLNSIINVCQTCINTNTFTTKIAFNLDID